MVDAFQQLDANGDGTVTAESSMGPPISSPAST
jgi:hypothetical protein